MSTQRYTRRDADAAFRLLTQTMGMPSGTGSGEWFLDCEDDNTVVVSTFYYQYGKRSQDFPLGHERMKYREFVEHVHYAVRVLQVYRDRL